ncbi:MAG: transporter [Campylobacterota bacterium]|nr:transporter [Campylobacterota bacterium]
MSQLIATIENIESVDNLNIVTFRCNNETLKMMSLDLNDSIQIGKKVVLTCKPTSVALAKPTMDKQAFCEMLSYANQIKVKVSSMDVGLLLSSIKLQFGDFSLESIITSASVQRMNLNEKDEVLALIKANELSIQEVLDD